MAPATRTQARPAATPPTAPSRPTPARSPRRPPPASPRRTRATPRRTARRAWSTANAPRAAAEEVQRSFARVKWFAVIGR
ncbi:hypothetical protein FE391_24925 [Nonomuraea sp. KC401]|nr:hypothetical protein FE391_24925 [Nonomuraea sp. KC401]